mmetsp:Transcript_22880/g.22151  ORF Transcript_22880/g.22151 Transcript_22880/m.22151 type:complete len:94 (-) Transcript_22880:755-1036(-)
MELGKYKQFKSYFEGMKEQVIKDSAIVVSTCNRSFGLKKVVSFSHVIIDEATQASEVETFLSLLSAKQAVLVGDHRQLGPVYGQKVSGPLSMF